MLHDTLKSAVYSSLTKPLPVKNEINSQSFMEEEKGGDRGEKSHLQLFQASEGARELTQMIHSLSKAPNLDGCSKYIAKNLLKGAQDLHSSLVMLAKLQEASKIVSQLKVKGIRELVEEDIGVQRTMHSMRFASQELRYSFDQTLVSCAKEMKTPSMLKPKQRSRFAEEETDLEGIKGSRRYGFQESRLSVDASARSSVGQRKKMPSNTRSELMEGKINAGELMVSKACQLRKSRFLADVSSRYAVEETKRVFQMKFNQSLECMEEEIGVREIMGLKRVEMKKSRYSLDKLPKSRGGELKRMSTLKLKQRSEYAEEDTDVEEMVHSKSIELVSTQELPNNVFDPRNRFCRSPKFHVRPKFEDRDYERKERLSDPDSPSLLSKQVKGQSIIAKLMGLDEIPSATIQTNKREEEKKSLIMPRHAFDIDSRPKTRKMQVGEMPSPMQKTRHKVIAAMQFKGLLKKSKGRDFRAKPRLFDESRCEKCSTSFNIVDGLPPTVIVKPLNLPCTEREGQKVAFLDNIYSNEEGIKLENMEILLDVKNEVEKEAAKKKRVTSYHSATTNPDKWASLAKNIASWLKPRKSKNLTSAMKNKKTSAAKSVKNSTDTKNDDKHCEEGNRNDPQEGTGSSLRNGTLTSHGLPEGTGKEAKPCVQNENQENLCEVLQKKTSTRIATEMEEDLMCRLMSSRSFINHAEEDFLIVAPHKVHYKRNAIGEDVMRNAKLYLDCGKELMTCKSHAKTSTRSSTGCNSLSQLAKEICSDIIGLISCSEAVNIFTSEDILSLMLERDLQCNEAMASANWDIEWADQVCAKEAGRAIVEIEVFVLSWLISEIAQDLVW